MSSAFVLPTDIAHHQNITAYTRRDKLVTILNSGFTATNSFYVINSTD